MGLQVFMQAIDDPATRAKLRAASLPQGATQLVQMTDDPLIQQNAVGLGKRVLKYRHDVSIEATPPDPAFARQIQADGANLKQQLENKYPEGMALLANYAKLQQRSNQPVSFDQSYTNTTVMVNARVGADVGVATDASVVANLGVVANAAAVATVAVVAAGYLVVTVFVI